MKLSFNYTTGFTLNLADHLPAGAVADDIENVYASWGEATIELKDGTEITVDIGNDMDSMDVDLKRPNEIVVLDKDYNKVSTF